MSDHTLFLHEEVMLLALCGEEGTLENGVWYDQAVGAAVAVELLLGERIELRGEKKIVDLVRTDPLGDPLLDEWLGKIAREEREWDLAAWIRDFANTPNLKHRVGGRLVERGILEEREGKVFFFFDRKLYPERDGAPEREIRERVRDAVLGDGEVDVRTAALVSIAKRAGILGLLFDKRELKECARRVDAIVDGDLVGEEVDHVIEGIQTAILVAVILPVIIT